MLLMQAIGKTGLQSVVYDLMEIVGIKCAEGYGQGQLCNTGSHTNNTYYTPAVSL